MNNNSTNPTESILKSLNSLVNSLNKTNSANDKINKLAEYKDNTEIKKILQYVYSPYKQFNISSKTVKARSASGQFSIFAESDIFSLLDDLISRTITGNDALDCCVSFVNAYPGYTDLILNIFDKDLKIRMDAKSINKAIPGLIPVFSVALCNSYKDRKDKVDFEKERWSASRKLDGARCVSIVYEDGHCECWSRQGKKFDTLRKIEDEISSLGLKNVVFDGECCIVDGNGDEHFDWIMKEIKRKNHTIEHPMYQVFDMLTLEEFNMQKKSPVFSERILRINEFFSTHKLHYAKPVTQTPVKSLEHFNILFNEAKEKDWEGLVIRKDVPYEGKRSNNMLKVKEFSDQEYVVEDLEFGPFRTIVDGKEITEDVLTNIIITHKGNKVSVGSGFSLDERRLYKEHPEKIIGKTVTVQYFEETKNRDGEYSLRFPVIKCVFENGRNI